jgi:hypothetical protein
MNTIRREPASRGRPGPCLDLLGILVKQCLQVDLDDVAVVAEPIRPAASDELRVAQAVGKFERTFMGEDEATHTSASHARHRCQPRRRDVARQDSGSGCSVPAVSGAGTYPGTATPAIRSDHKGHGGFLEGTAYLDGDDQKAQGNLPAVGMVRTLLLGFWGSFYVDLGEY